MRRLPRCEGERSFTLVEVLVAAALTVLVTGTLLGVIATMLGNWSRVQGRMVAGAQAQRVFDQLAQDLQGAVCGEGGGVCLAATIQPNEGASGVWVSGSKPIAASLDPANPSLRDARFGAGGASLRLFTTRPGLDARTGDGAAPAAVSYQIIRRHPTPGSAESRYLFYRSEVTAAATFAAGFDLAASAYSTADESEGAPGNLIRPPLRYLLAENVIDFGLRLHARNPGLNGTTLVFPTSSTDLEYLARAVEGPIGERMPCVVDVMVRILTEEGMRQIAALEANRISGDWWTIAVANSHVFTRRMVVMGVAR